MASPSLNEIQSLPDVLTSEHYVINFGSVPGAGDTYRLTLQCSSVPMPGMGMEPLEQRFAGGHKRKFSGAKSYTGTFTAEFTETVDTRALEVFRNWHEYCRGTNSGYSTGYVGDYSVTAIVQIYDSAGNLADYVNIYRCFPQEIGEIALNADGTAAVRVSMTMSYDYCEFANAALR